MPELPAVEFTKRLIEYNSHKKVIKSVQFVPSPDELIFSKDAIETLNSSIGFRIEEVGRWGKQLWITLADNKNSRVLLMHLGMTGFVQFKGQDRLLYESSPSNKKNTREVSVDWPPKFTKLIIKFDDEDDSEMAFCDARRLAKVDILCTTNCFDVKDSIINKFKLGFDPLLSIPDRQEFKELIQTELKRKINMKTLLMQQSFVAGLGNWMVDDILMLAGINPKRIVSSLTNNEIDSLHKSIEDVTAISVAANADKSKFPKGWLFHIRWKHGKETLTGLKVESTRIGGRSTFWVPELQK